MGELLSISSFEAELKSILNWWSTEMVDKDNGGFIGRIDGYGIQYPNADKGVILNTRILWSFSSAANSGYTNHSKTAHIAFDYIREHFVDQENGGLFWMLDFEGNPVDTKKQIYAQAFGIYALSEYFLLTKKEEAINLAFELFELIESHSLDKIKGGYIEALTADWRALADVRLSEKEANDAKTMNTHLHLLECYTNLYRCDQRSEIYEALKNLILLYHDRFVEEDSGRLKLFFDENWIENMTHHSYGHEIESVWLLNEAAHILADQDIIAKIEKITIKIAHRVLDEGIDFKGSIYNDKSLDGHNDPLREWWVTAEGVIGFYDTYQKTKAQKFLKASERAWEYIQKYLIDRANGEWYWSCDEYGKPTLTEDKAGPWKSCYHNSRMCLEMIRRLKA